LTSEGLPVMAVEMGKKMCEKALPEKKKKKKRGRE
jgi:hypothetical protein